MVHGEHLTQQICNYNLIANSILNPAKWLIQLEEELREHHLQMSNDFKKKIFFKKKIKLNFSN